MSEEKKNLGLCQAPIEVLAHDGGCCEYIQWKDKLPICTSPDGMCPDFSDYF